MARQRAIQLMEAVLDAVGVIDRTDGSRVALIEGMDSVRAILADAYGDDFEEDLAEKLGDSDDEDADFPDEEEGD